VLLAAASLAAPAASETAKERAAAEVARIAALPAKGDPVQCLMIANIDESRPVGTTMILVRQGANMWHRNRLQNSCPGLRPDRILTYRTAGSLVCRGDRMDVVDPISRITVGPCILGDFEPIESPYASTRSE
jgi:hypothetical protein